MNILSLRVLEVVGLDSSDILVRDFASVVSYKSHPFYVLVYIRYQSTGYTILHYFNLSSISMQTLAGRGDVSQLKCDWIFEDPHISDNSGSTIYNHFWSVST